MLNRFLGTENREKVIRSLQRQKIVRSDLEFATAIADVAEIVEYRPGATLIVQDNVDDEIFFILSGSVSITVNGRETAIRRDDEHIGELVLINPGWRRSASAVAIGVVVVAKVTESQFSPLCDQFPVVWKYIAETLSTRLIERNKLVAGPNPRPIVFIGSSVEALPVARAIQTAFLHDTFTVRIWTDKVFGAGKAVMEDLEAQIKSADFAVLVLSSDDIVSSRTVDSVAPRDNVVFELGLFMGALGRKRTFFATPVGVKDLKIPSDILGITALNYKIGEPEDLASDVGPLCDHLRTIITTLGTK